LSELKIGIILGSTRPGRNGKAVADWMLDKAQARIGADYDLIDLADHPLPHMDEPMSPMLGQYAGEHTKAWAATIAPYDAYVFVTPEYNHSTSGVLKNAIDYLYAEWNNKAAAFVSYGGVGGARAIEHLRAVCSELQIAHVPPAAVVLDVLRLRELLHLPSRRGDPRRRRHRHVRPTRSLGRRAQTPSQGDPAIGVSRARPPWDIRDSTMPIGIRYRRPLSTRTRCSACTSAPRASCRSRPRTHRRI
jgi:NAD(P)H-dependent FMN reductase